MPRRNHKNKRYSSELKKQAVQDWLEGKGIQYAICTTREDTKSGSEVCLRMSSTSPRPSDENSPPAAQQGENKTFLFNL